MSNIASNPWQQLAVLRETVTKTGRMLHEAQILQLKMWPLATIPTLKNHQFQVDMDGEQILYQFTMVKGARAPSQMKKRLQILENSIQAMLGSQWLVRITVGEKILFEGTRKIDVNRHPKV